MHVVNRIQMSLKYLVPDISKAVRMSEARP